MRIEIFLPNGINELEIERVKNEVKVKLSEQEFELTPPAEENIPELEAEEDDDEFEDDDEDDEEGNDEEEVEDEDDK